MRDLIELQHYPPYAGKPCYRLQVQLLPAFEPTGCPYDFFPGIGLPGNPAAIPCTVHIRWPSPLPDNFHTVSSSFGFGLFWISLYALWACSTTSGL